MRKARQIRSGKAPVPVTSLNALCRVWLAVAITLLVAGCAQDTNTLICPEGQSRDGNQCISSDVAIDLPCVDVENPEPAGAEPPRVEGEDCATWADCEGQLVCLFDPIAGGLCSERCESQGCPTGEICSVAGICTDAGSAGPGDECNNNDGCVVGFVCDANTELCVEICDPREPICPESLACIPLPSGLGRCLRQCN